MKKLNHTIKDFDIIGIAIKKMLPDPRYARKISANEAMEILRANLIKYNIDGVKINTETINQWLDEKVIRGEIVGKGTVARYEIIEDDILNMCLFLGIGGILEALGLRQKMKHPETNIDVIMEYTPQKQYKAKLTTIDVEIMSVIHQLKNGNVFKIIQEAIEEYDLKNDK
jgi:hypothetical protein